ncbi:hypothetical protein NCC78_10360 [Micromonospora phytophila]|uniref:hypothetical protein n=1 Tax=Micromonospora phytophila TaxID=709888 RepID=UPI00203033CC|nr:hypothetical protein [Micromonospora phytophila]MCM0675089.1 hypothetical protein [Micromonospora phytophila]
MPVNYAELLAQVVPVVAIALGLEIRSMADRIRATGDASVWRRGLLLNLSVALLVLTFVEMKALAVVAGDDFLNTWTYVLIAAIVTAFLAPVFDALPASSLPGWNEVRNLSKTKGRRWLLALVVLALFLLLDVLFIVGTLFT